MTSKKEHEEIVRKVHEERGWEQPFRVIVDDDIGNPRYQLAACDHCGREFTFVLDADRYRSWKDRRMLVQAAMPGIAPRTGRS